MKQSSDKIKHYDAQTATEAQFEDAALVGVPDEIYHALPSRFVSKHDLDVFEKCPSTYQAMKLGAIDTAATETPTLIFGRAFHAAVLQPQAYADSFAIAPAVDRRTKAGKEAYAAFAAENAGKTLLTEEQAAEIDKMRERVLAAAGDILRDEHGNAEIVLTHHWGLFDGLFIRGKLDFLAIDDENKRALIVDLKTTSDASAAAFKNDAARYDYHIQAAIYDWLFRARFGEEYDVRFRFVCVEKGGNNPVAQYELSEDFMRLGFDEFYAEAADLAQAIRAGNFPDYNNGEIAVIDAPAWRTARAR